MLPARLGKVNGMPKHVFDFIRHVIQIAFGRADPFDGLAGLLQHRELCLFRHNSVNLIYEVMTMHIIFRGCD